MLLTLILSNRRSGSNNWTRSNEDFVGEDPIRASCRSRHGKGTTRKTSATSNVASLRPNDPKNVGHQKSTIFGVNCRVAMVSFSTHQQHGHCLQKQVYQWQNLVIFLIIAAFSKKYCTISKVIRERWIGILCGSNEKSQKCRRKQIQNLTGEPPADNMTPTGTLL